MYRRWTAEEHARFLEGIVRFGKDWKRVHTLVKTRSLTQLRTHAQKVFRKSGLLKIGVGRDVEEELRAAGYRDLQKREAGATAGAGASAGVGVGYESSRQGHENETGERDDGGADDQKDGEDDEDEDEDGDLEDEDEDEDEEERPRRRHKPDSGDSGPADAVAGVAAAVE